MKMRQARRLHKQAMTIRTPADEDGLLIKKVVITESFKQWIRRHFKKIAKQIEPSPKLKKVLNPKKDGVK